MRFFWGRRSARGSSWNSSSIFCVSAAWKGLGMGSTRKKKPSMRYLTEIASSLGSICTSEAPLRAARWRM